MIGKYHIVAAINRGNRIAKNSANAILAEPVTPILDNDDRKLKSGQKIVVRKDGYPNMYGKFVRYINEDLAEITADTGTTLKVLIEELHIDKIGGHTLVR